MMKKMNTAAISSRVLYRNHSQRALKRTRIGAIREYRELRDFTQRVVQAVADLFKFTIL